MSDRTRIAHPLIALSAEHRRVTLTADFASIFLLTRRRRLVVIEDARFRRFVDVWHLLEEEITGKFLKASGWNSEFLIARWAGRLGLRRIVIFFRQINCMFLQTLQTECMYAGKAFRVFEWFPT